MKRILVVIDYYVPGFKAGGPVRTLQYLVDNLGDEFEFNIVTGDRDLGDTGPYPGVKTDTWQQVGKARVFYTAAAKLSLGRLRGILRETPHDLLYLNSLFSPRFTLWPLLLRRLGLIPRVPTILRVRGELNRGALAIKTAKKRAYLALTTRLGLYRGLLWHASTDLEVEDIRRHFGRETRIVTAPNLSMPVPEIALTPRGKKPGELKIVFLSRVARKKNLAAALRMLRGLSGKVALDIYGPLEEPGYWSECQDIIRALPAAVTVEYKGGATPDRVVEVLGAYHVFLFPTLGENFGHAIFEALAAGCPVLISDRTPWRNLADKGCGWDLPLEDEPAFRRGLQEAVDLDAGGFLEMSRGARACALDYVDNSNSMQQNRSLLRG